MDKQDLLNIIPIDVVENENVVLRKQIVKNEKFLVDIKNATIFNVQKIIEDYQDGKILSGQKKKLNDIKKDAINDIINNSDAYSIKVDQISKLIPGIDREQFYLLDRIKKEVDDIKYHEILDSKFYEDIVLTKIIFNLLYHNILCNKSILLDTISKIEFINGSTKSTLSISSKKIDIEFGSMACLFKNKCNNMLSKIKHGISLYSVLLSCYLTSYISKDIFIAKIEDIGKKINNLSINSQEEIKNKKMEMADYIEKINKEKQRNKNNQELMNKELHEKKGNDIKLEKYRQLCSIKYTTDLRNNIDDVEKKINANRFNIQKYKDEIVSSDNHIKNSILEYESCVRYITSRHYLAYKCISND